MEEETVASRTCIIHSLWMTEAISKILALVEWFWSYDDLVNLNRTQKQIKQW
jgi:hypothetical protein